MPSKSHRKSLFSGGIEEKNWSETRLLFASFSKEQKQSSGGAL